MHRGRAPRTDRGLGGVEEPVEGCYTAPEGDEVVQGDKNLTPEDNRYFHIIDLLGLKPLTN